MQRALTISLALLLLPLLVLAANTPAPVGGPSFTSTPKSLQTVIQNIFNLALLVSGILAFGAVIYGAFMYTFSAGNPGMQSDARDQILQAFLGLALLLGGYLVLNLINPNLTNMTLSPLPAVEAPKSPYNPRYLVGNCSLLTSPWGDPDSLRPYFGVNAEMASRIVNQESGNRPFAESSMDKCKDGNKFSMGLFQINIIAHGGNLGCEAGIFETNGGGTQGNCLRRNPVKKYCEEWDCKVVAGKEAAYNSCKAIAKDPQRNIEYASRISNKGANWGPWQYTYDLCKGAQ